MNSAASDVRCTVDARTFVEYEGQARTVLAALEAGDQPDLDAVSKDFGTRVEFLLCDLFRMDPATAGHSCDGVMIVRATIQPGRVLALTGSAYCVGDREQWLIPAEIACRFADGKEPVLELLTVRVGNAALGSLADHRTRSITKASDLSEWLVAFEIESDQP